MKNKVIVFLDIDGVIRKDKEDCNRFSIDCIQAMNRIVNNSGARLQFVLSSDVRHIFLDVEQARIVFQRFGCSFFPSSFTPSIFDTKWNQLNSEQQSVVRAVQINAWLRNNNRTSNTPWIVIDDLEMRYGFERARTLMPFQDYGKYLEDANYVQTKNSICDEGKQQELMQKIKKLAAA